MNQNEKLILGIDIGKSGGMTLITEKQKIIYSIPMPMKSILVGKKEKQNYDIPEIVSFIDIYKENIYLVICEKLYAMPGQYSQTAMSLGYGVGIFEAIQATLGLDFLQVDPKRWQNTLFKGLPRHDSKENSKKVASKLFPAQNFKKTARCKVINDGLTDSQLIQYYGLMYAQK